MYCIRDTGTELQQCRPQRIQLPTIFRGKGCRAIDVQTPGNLEKPMSLHNKVHVETEVA